MNKFRFTIKILAIAMFTFAFASMAQAQATRTWVSGVGDDANPCSRTAPCKTFAGAISKTFINGEIDVLDPGGYGTLTITKSITIDGGHGAGWASVLASGSPAGFIVNVAGNANDPLRTVRIRNIQFNGAGASGSVGTRTGVRGIKVLSAFAVYIEGVTISDFSDRGISDERSGSGKLYVTDTIVRNSGASNVVIIPQASTAINAVLDNVHAEGSGSNSGIVFDGSAAGASIKAVVRESYGTGNAQDGLTVVGTSDVLAEGSVFSDNNNGILANSPAVVRLSNCSLTHNSNSIVGPSQVSSASTNNINGNTTNTQPAGPPINQT
jgi:hypothetical protein